jgi:hypothetical protein
MIDLKWRTKRCEVRVMQKEQQRKRRETINAHKRRIWAEAAKRRAELNRVLHVRGVNGVKI